MLRRATKNGGEQVTWSEDDTINQTVQSAAGTNSGPKNSVSNFPA